MSRFAVRAGRIASPLSKAKRIASRAALLLLFSPLILILIFRFLPVPLTPLMVMRFMHGYGIRNDWVAYNRIATCYGTSSCGLGGQFLLPRAFRLRRRCSSGSDRCLVAWWTPARRQHYHHANGTDLLLWPGRSTMRKALEAWLTPQLALVWPKRRILEVYLNIVEFGPGVYGTEAAAQYYFHRHAAQLTTEQAVRLAVILPDPLDWSPAHPGPYVFQRALIILDRIKEIGPLLNCTR
jgi:monofunctional glycosyltransferase